MQNQNQPERRRAQPSNRENDHVLQDLLRRAIRQESKTTQMMAFIGMKTDGRNPIHRGHT